jgi:hypothetical protein
MMAEGQSKNWSLKKYRQEVEIKHKCKFITTNFLLNFL